MRFLKQSTATVVILGPFLDETDGKTPETGLTVTSMDVDLYKHDDDMSVASPYTKVDLTITVLDGGTNDMAHIANGYYALELTATDSNTLGRLMITANISGAIPVWHEFIVVPANTFDSFVLGTDVLTADLTQIGGDTQSATDLKDFADAGYDPATNKVQGVVLTDTCTTNTDMVGTDNAALASVCTEARLAELDAANLPSDVDDILADTTAIETKVDTAITNIAAVKVDTAATLADTGSDGVVVAAGSKSGYSLAADQSGVTVGTVTTLTNVPTNFTSLAITTAGAVTAGTVSDKTGYGLADNAITAAKIQTDAIAADEIAAAACNKIADHIIRRSYGTCRASSDGDSVAFRSLLGAVAMLVNKKDASSGTSLVVKHEDDSTTFETSALTSDSDADPITVIDTSGP